MQLYISLYIIWFFGFIFTSQIVFFIFIKYSCTKGFHRRSLQTFYFISFVIQLCFLRVSVLTRNIVLLSKHLIQTNFITITFVRNHHNGLSQWCLILNEINQLLSFSCRNSINTKVLHFLLFSCSTLKFFLTNESPINNSLFTLKYLPFSFGTQGESQYQDVVYQYRDSHVKDKTVAPTVLSLTWESPYLGKAVFILRRGLIRAHLLLFTENHQK